MLPTSASTSGPVQEVPRNRMAQRFLGQDRRREDYSGNLAECMFLRVLRGFLPRSVLQMRTKPVSLFKGDKRLYSKLSGVMLYCWHVGRSRGANWRTVCLFCAGGEPRPHTC